MRFQFTFFLIFFVGTVVGISIGPSQGEYYQYRDKNGYVVFTDNLASVPEDKLDEAEAAAHREISSPSSYDRGHPADHSPQMLSTSEGAWERDLKNQAAALDTERTTLEKRFKELRLEQAALAQSPGSKASAAEKNAYQKRIDALNRNVAAYETDRKQFEKKVAELMGNAMSGR